MKSFPIHHLKRLGYKQAIFYYDLDLSPQIIIMDLMPLNELSLHNFHWQLRMGRVFQLQFDDRLWSWEAWLK